MFLAQGTRKISVNRESLRYASEFDGELLGNCDDIVAILAKKLGWSDFSSDGDVEEVTREDIEKTAEENKNESEKENGEEAPPEKKLVSRHSKILLRNG